MLFLLCLLLFSGYTYGMYNNQSNSDLVKKHKKEQQEYQEKVRSQQKKQEKLRTEQAEKEAKQKKSLEKERIKQQKLQEKEETKRAKLQRQLDKKTKDLPQIYPAKQTPTDTSSMTWGTSILLHKKRTELPKFNDDKTKSL